MNEEGRILIVDDDGIVRKVLRRDLSRLGFDCTTASDGQEALEKLQAGDFDVALIDLQMPRMDGIMLLRALGEAQVDTVPIILSGHGQISKAAEETRLGAFDFIEKPADAEVIGRTVGRAVRHCQAVRQARAMTLAAARWEATFDASPDMIVVVSLDQRISHTNRAVTERLRCAKDDLADRDCHEALCGGDHSPADCPFRRSIERGTSQPTEFSQRMWGGEFELMSSPLRDDSRQVRGWMHVVRDITERKRAELELAEVHAQNALMLASISSILICIDSGGRITQWNAAAESTFGVSSTGALGRTLGQCGIQWEFAAIEAGISECLAAESPVRVDDIRFTNGEGKAGFLAVTMSHMKGTGPQHRGVLILGRDVTGHRFLESQLAQAQKLEGIGQLAAGIAHEINTPMQYVGDNTRFLKESFDDLLALLRDYEAVLAQAGQRSLSRESLRKLESTVAKADVQYLIEEIPSAIQQSLEGIGRVTRIVRAMREFSHPGTEEKTAADINRAIENTVTVSRNEWKYVAEVQTDLDDGLPPVLCLPSELNQVILNLIVNAAHAIADRVGDGSSEKGTITICTRREGDWVEIRVGDTGTGIPEPIREYVFDPFFTTKQVGRGTGQGLAIARSVIVDKHAGTIAFETEAGEGTTLIIRLPIDPALAEQTHAAVKENANVA